MLALGSDHAGLPLKREIMGFLDENGIEYKDFGTYTEDSCDYAVFAERVCLAIQSGECEQGVLCCGTGVGISMAANKMRGIRCVVCTDCYSAKMSREHNNANVLAMGSRVVGAELAKMIVDTFLKTGFLGGRHERRVQQIMALERGETLQ